MLADAPKMVKNNKKGTFKNDDELKDWLLN